MGLGSRSRSGIAGHCNWRWKRWCGRTRNAQGWSLRNRVDDIPLLAQHFLERFARKLGRSRLKLTLANLQELQRYNWPGKIRELQHVLERACIVAVDGRLRFDLPTETSKLAAARSGSETTSTPTPTILSAAELRQLEADNLRAALASSNGKIYGPNGAAARLGMKPTTLTSRLKVLSITANQEGGKGEGLSSLRKCDCRLPTRDGDRYDRELTHSFGYNGWPNRASQAAIGSQQASRAEMALIFTARRRHTLRLVKRRNTPGIAAYAAIPVRHRLD